MVALIPAGGGPRPHRRAQVPAPAAHGCPRPAPYTDTSRPIVDHVQTITVTVPAALPVVIVVVVIVLSVALGRRWRRRLGGRHRRPGPPATRGAQTPATWRLTAGCAGTRVGPRTDRCRWQSPREA